MLKSLFKKSNELIAKSDEVVISTDEEQITAINDSGLFLEEYYIKTNPDVNPEQALIHFYFNGQSEGRKPSYLFDPLFYLNKYDDVKSAQIPPLCHFIEHGESERRAPSPYVNIHYLTSNIESKGFSKNFLDYFYQNEINESLNAHPYFDIEYYLSNNPDIADAGISPYEHFLGTGVYEGRNPCADIDIEEYVKIYQVNKDEINPFYHFINESGEEYLSNKIKESEVVEETHEKPDPNIIEDYKQKGSHYEEPDYLDAPDIQTKVKALAYYLPQFHPFKENDEWWGQGFTEWSNVTRGQPRFEGHYQPHLPKHLGFYDLRVKEAMLEQVRFAKAAGIHGFCFYHYWFNGKRLMEKPVNMLLENKDIDIPFCIMWANENWTRTWDGLENDILIAQDYLKEDDIPFIQDLGRHFGDHRYIRVDGRPLFFIYRPAIIPDAKNTIAKWRKLCKELINEEPLFYMAQAFGSEDPSEFGMDGAIEFPPHKIAAGLEDCSRSLYVFDENFTGHYPSYDELINSSLKESVHEYPLIRGVTPSWDNEARKPGRGMGFVGSTPKKYENWLSTIVKYAEKNPIAENESFVVINAWNEWAEGAHIEPDLYWGAAYLNATYRAINGVKPLTGKYPLVLVGHDAYKHGAQLLTLNIFKTLKQQFGCDVRLVILGEGPLVEEYEKVGPTYVCHNDLETFTQITRQLQQEIGVTRAICNTTVSGRAATILHQQGFEFISLIHELENLIREYKLESEVSDIAEYANKVIFAAKAVQDSFVKVSEKDINDKLIIHPQGIYQQVSYDDKAYASVRNELGLDKNAKLVVNVGFADLRKGFDIFVNTAKVLVEQDPSYHFLWIGDIESSLKHWLKSDLNSNLLKEHFHNIPFTNQISKYLSAANVFAMTSREDPFPSVVMESLAIGTPVVGFEGGGGFTELLEEPINGSIVPMADIQAMSKAIKQQCEGDSETKQDKRKEQAGSKFRWDEYVFSLLQYLDPSLKKISVSVPNYNYEQHIAERLESIFAQHYPIFEVLVLDDLSPDNSIQVIEKTAKVFEREIHLIVNKENSGSVFKQWKKGSDLARGDYLWIAEADDSAEPSFLSEIFEDGKPFTVAYTDSKQVDENNKYLADDYRYYYDQPMTELLNNGGIYAGNKIISNCLSIKNQFMNVSSVVFNSDSLRQCFDANMDELLTYKVAGDWFVYVQLLAENNATCKLIDSALNTHRRHSNSVTRQNYAVQLEEISNVHRITKEYCDSASQVEYLEEVKKILIQ